MTESEHCYRVSPLLSCPGSGGKNFTINLKKRSLVSDREKNKGSIVGTEEERKIKWKWFHVV